MIAFLGVSRGDLSEAAHGVTRSFSLLCICFYLQALKSNARVDFKRDFEATESTRLAVLEP